MNDIEFAVMNFSLPHLPLYSSFDLDKCLKSMKPGDFGQNPCTYHLAVESDMYNFAGSIYDFLTKNGFADSTDTGNNLSYVLELRDKGRDLIKCGSYKAFLEKEKTDEISKKERKRKTERYSTEI